MKQMSSTKVASQSARLVYSIRWRSNEDEGGSWLQCIKSFLVESVAVIACLLIESNAKDTAGIREPKVFSGCETHRCGVWADGRSHRVVQREHLRGWLKWICAQVISVRIQQL